MRAREAQRALARELRRMERGDPKPRGRTPEQMRSEIDPRYAAWLYATRGARRTLEGKTE